MSDLNYTGPVTRIIFQSVVNPKDKFGLDLHVYDEDVDSIAKIEARYAEDGYVPINTIKLYSVRGVLEPRKPRQSRIGPAGYPTRSAFLRS